LLKQTGEADFLVAENLFSTLLFFEQLAFWLEKQSFLS